MALMLHLGDVGKCVRLIGEWSVHNQESGDLQPTLLGSDSGVLGQLRSQNDVIMICLRLTATSNSFSHPYNTYTKCSSTLICCPLAFGNRWLWHGWHGWGRQPPQTASHIHIRHELRARLITFRFFVCWQRLIARNVGVLFGSKASHFVHSLSHWWAE